MPSRHKVWIKAPNSIEIRLFQKRPNGTWKELGRSLVDRIQRKTFARLGTPLHSTDPAEVKVQIRWPDTQTTTSEAEWKTYNIGRVGRDTGWKVYQSPQAIRSGILAEVDTSTPAESYKVWVEAPGASEIRLYQQKPGQSAKVQVCAAPGRKLQCRTFAKLSNKDASKPARIKIKIRWKKDQRAGKPEWEMMAWRDVRAHTGWITYASPFARLGGAVSADTGVPAEESGEDEDAAEAEVAAASVKGSKRAAGFVSAAEAEENALLENTTTSFVNQPASAEDYGDVPTVPEEESEESDDFTPMSTGKKVGLAALGLVGLTGLGFVTKRALKR